MGISILYKYTCVQFQKLLAEIRKKKHVYQTRTIEVVTDEKE